MPKSFSIVPISAFADNYLWLIHNNRKAWIVDPGDAAPVLTTLRSSHLELEGILLTHHHADHCGGVVELCTLFPNLTVYGPAEESIPGTTHPLRAGNEITLTSLGLTLTVLEVPGHTLGHVAYVGQDCLFCGDTLFAAGCGRIFEGTPAQMFHSLAQLAALPDKTAVYCAHEYTVRNLDFALKVDPHNQELQNWAREARAQREQGEPTLPSQIGRERRANPFLRSTDIALTPALDHYLGHPVGTDPLTRFTVLRAWKNQC
ncbi:MAG: hydroxyacylglutathione hydrolase [Ferrovum myxofaciens]|uniref:Hydroxyacylglutathione hydrolase n=2 Tax=Ferrovum myxofaciens TaxID=416213 RepID=A0A859A9T8_9PROT|nr:hydroxyacylglutathione hydrolase [Ferrovum myxofaciens]NDU90895.1 hydroxyacylglutathione hydrolase [Ferrovum sp.]KXW58304.1 hydroxyacylglutathione hydrolase [Ferrovum myxofaciens]MBU6993974.1 hydroxyacylglutathione hydrolase [Ferrovum myxofaciens]QKE37917.1 MAG: hydroxyacylglutathione hydrolase [Ferrovum myxofaciens]QKE40526.1 MAG: hydroxyacylglutathione hydrolase [Ferrovum myxofaciens]